MDKQEHDRDAVVLLVLGRATVPIAMDVGGDVSHGSLFALKLGLARTIASKLTDSDALENVNGFLDGKPHSSKRYTGMNIPTDADLQTGDRVRVFANFPNPSGSSGEFRAEREYFEVDDEDSYSPLQFKALENVTWLTGKRRHAAAEEEERERKAEERQRKERGRKRSQDRRGGGGRGRASGRGCASGRGRGRGRGRVRSRGDSGRPDMATDSLVGLFDRSK